MAGDIFGKSVVSKGGPLARSETCALYIGGDTSPGSMIGLAQNVQITYGQQLQRVYELGSQNTFMVSGRTQGSLQMARIIGQQDLLSAGTSTLFATLGEDFFEVQGSAEGNQCAGNPGGTLTLQDKCTNVTYVCSGCYVTQSSVGVDANGSVVTENVSIEFQRLDISAV